MDLDARVGPLNVLDERGARRAQVPDVHPQVIALRAFRVVGVLTALCVLAEIGDPRRFTRGEQVARVPLRVSWTVG